MIPFGLFQAYLKSDKTSIEVRALEMSPDTFTIRLADVHQAMLASITSLQVRFYSPVSRRSVSFDLASYQILPVLTEHKKSESEINPLDSSIKNKRLPSDGSHYYRTYQIKTTDPKYSDEARRLTDEYLTYIRHRTSMFPEELSHTYYPPYPEDKEDVFCSDWKAQREILAQEIMKELTKMGEGPQREGTIRNVMAGTEEADRSGEYGIVVKYDSQLKKFLTTNPAAYLKSVLAQSGLEGHPLCSQKLTHVYFGDAFCPLLFPQAEQYEPILIHCKRHGLCPVFQLAPVSESLVSDICENLLFLNEILLQQNCRAELEAGDAGILEFCRELDGFDKVNKGILMCKKKKDPRMTYMTEEASGAIAHQTSLLMLDQTEDAIYLPYYQTNTGTFCPLRAMVDQGDRSRQTRIRTCHQICQKKRILYPSHLSMVGIGNSLFGFSSGSLIRGYQESKKRIVINL